MGNFKMGPLLDMAEKINCEILSMKHWFDEIPQLVAIGDGVRFVRVNKMFQKILGWTPDEIVQMQWISLMHPDDIQPTLDIIDPVGGGGLLNLFNRYRTKCGSYVWLQWSVSPMNRFGEVHISATPHYEDSPFAEWLKELGEERHHNPEKGNLSKIEEVGAEGLLKGE